MTSASVGFALLALMLSDMSAKYSPTSFDLFVFFGLLTSLSVVALLEEAPALEWPNGTKGVLGECVLHLEHHPQH